MLGVTAAVAAYNLKPGVKPSLGQKRWQYCWWSLVFGYMIVDCSIQSTYIMLLFHHIDLFQVEKIQQTGDL